MKKNQPIKGIYSDKDIAGMDYHLRDSPTESQLRIEKYLRKYEDLSDKNFLHVGIGNSNIAKKFRNAGRIDGITVVQEEINKGYEAAQENYHIYLIDKHTKNILRLSGHYHYIIDNNIGSYAPSIIDMIALLERYKILLASEGKLLTEESGLRYIHKNSKCPPITSQILKYLAKDFIVTKKDNYVILLTVDKERKSLSWRFIHSVLVSVLLILGITKLSVLITDVYSRFRQSRRR